MIGFNRLYISITQQCNLACKHCLRGDAKNVVVDDKIIFNAFENVTFINSLNLTGGEPLLHPEKLLTVNDAILKNKTQVLDIAIVTNATLWNAKIKEAVLSLKISSPRLVLALSNDGFHKEEIKRLGLKDYTNEIIEFGEKKGIVVKLLELRGNQVRIMGRAKNLDFKTLSQLSGESEGYNFKEYKTPQYVDVKQQLTKDNKFALNAAVNADGSVGGLYEEWDYYENPENVVFNLKDKSFDEYYTSEQQ